MSTSLPSEEEVKRLALLILIARALDREQLGGGAFSAEGMQEAERLIDTDPDFRYLHQAWLSGVWSGFSPYATEFSVEALRAEANRLRVSEEHPAQMVRYQVLVYGGGLALIGLLTTILASETLAGWALLVQGIVVALALSVGAFFLSGVLTEKGRTTLFQMLEPDVPEPAWRPFTLALMTLYIVAFATIGLAGLSELLYFHDIATTKEELGDPFGDSVAFYVWSFLNAIPVLEIPQTVRWELHVDFTDHVSPVLLLLYKVAVILPAIATGRFAWRETRRARAAKAAQ